MTSPQPDPCCALAWDTAHFGFGVARVRGDTLTPTLGTEIDAWCARSETRCLYFLARPEDAVTARVAESGGYRLADLRVVLVHELRPDASKARKPVRWPLRVAGAGDSDALEDIARRSYRLSRFYFDPGFPTDRVDALYETWIRRSLTGYADAVLVTGPVGAPFGFVTCLRSAEAAPGRIGLLGVAADRQGQGVGRALVSGAIDWFRRSGSARVEVATQGRNADAQRSYQRCGFVTDQVRIWYHKWYR